VLAAEAPVDDVSSIPYKLDQIIFFSESFVSHRNARFLGSRVEANRRKDSREGTEHLGGRIKLGDFAKANPSTPYFLTKLTKTFGGFPDSLPSYLCWERASQ